MFVIHDFEPGEVAPTTELVLRHIHPEDRDAAWESRDAAVEVGEPFTFLHRIVGADGCERIVLAAGHLEDDDGAPVIDGHLVDPTKMRQDASAAGVDPMVADFHEHRVVTEQAKGVLMQLYSVDADTAFAALSTLSIGANRKVRDVAALLVAAAVGATTPTRREATSAPALSQELLLDRLT